MIEKRKVYNLPTGHLIVDNYSKGPLETLSIGDYGKKHNVKADFLGYTRPINGVPNMECMPLSEKWVITLSSQYGCPLKCTFCDVPKTRFSGDATFFDLYEQLLNARELFPEITYTERLNIHFARMGEPTFNSAVFEFAEWSYKNKRQLQEDLDLRVEVLHPVLSTALPKTCTNLKDKLLKWCHIKNEIYNGQAGLQLSINSTNDNQRDQMFSKLSLSLEEISIIAKTLPKPLGRKYTLNFAYATGFEIDAHKLRTLFNPKDFMVKVTPIHNNYSCKENSIETLDGYSSYVPYEQVEQKLKEEGFDVLVFIPSMDEEDGLITCGNAVLSGSTPKNAL